jgi:hypothetical protein
MAMIAGHQTAPFPLMLWTVLADRRARIGIATGGLAAALGGGLLLATSDHLVDPVEFGVEIAVAILGTVAAALVWLRRRPANPVTLMLLAFVLAARLAAGRERRARAQPRGAGRLSRAAARLPARLRLPGREADRSP